MVFSSLASMGQKLWDYFEGPDPILIQPEDTEILRQKMVLLSSLKNRA